MSVSWSTCFLLVSSLGAAGPAPVVVYQNQARILPNAMVDNDHLLIEKQALREWTGLDLKPQGACMGDLCVPLGSAGAKITIAKNGKDMVDWTLLAEKLKQPLVRDSEENVFCFGAIPLVRRASVESGLAPDFAVPDREGKIVRLSDFRGKKVLVLTWASWCGCSLDLPGWQKIYDELKDRNFIIVAAAQDTAGESAAGKFYDRAKATYITLIDRDHQVSALFGLVNVPSGIWIDEEGHIVRAPEVAYSRNMFGVDGRRYVAALRDWVDKGPKSEFVMTPSSLAKEMPAPSADRSRADVYFALGTYFEQKGNHTKAVKYWREAQALEPESWNFHRQEWAFTPEVAGKNWLKKVSGLKGKPYYKPLQLPKAPANEPSK